MMKLSYLFGGSVRIFVISVLLKLVRWQTTFKSAKEKNNQLLFNRYVQPFYSLGTASRRRVIVLTKSYLNISKSAQQSCTASFNLKIQGQSRPVLLYLKNKTTALKDHCPSLRRWDDLGRIQTEGEEALYFPPFMIVSLSKDQEYAMIKNYSIVCPLSRNSFLS